MTTTRELDPTVRALFEDVVELAPAERRARLARETDAARVTEVEALLAAAEAAPEFLERPAVESDLVGHRAGPWIVEERLSAGGESDVHRARRAEGEPGWRVALKVLRRRAEGTEARLRFEDERRTLAALNHPFIVPLVDAGVLADGRPYLATRLVDGVQLDAYAAPLDLAARLRLFLAIASAVQHAHERLIAHCDLKPANVLVTSAGIPQLLDFGIARLVSSAGDGPRALTPGYASPEQLAGLPLGTASDVWSLGVVLHELATGCRPRFDASDGAPLPASATLLDPAHAPALPPPDADRSRLARALRGDFDALVARALAFDAGERYGSVAALAADVERFLARRPIAARPPSRARRALLFVRRNRVASLAALLGLIALVVAGFGSYRELLHARTEAGRGWQAHAQAALAARMLEDLARAAHAGASTSLEGALDAAAADLAGEPRLGPETEGRLRIALGALSLEVGRQPEAAAHLERALALATTTSGFGAQDVARIRELLARCADAPAQAQGSQPARSRNQ